ncbi:WD repeat, SAM and U-box domain-containing protein 1 isoform X2 [Scleropages formosus]|uniref:WD repeat, SAM and U-box domain-containing protein 1 isoform X2 n=1 Tax=Scleropages formosus TaxID=113540 RepID=UPI000879083A|nr:WD repeat, SAM and U-box domain-containing protein 1 isoform X2 [Scleropages formosus]
MVSLICTLQDHRDDVNWCAFSASLLATCSTDKTVRVYSVRDFSELPFSPLTGHGYGVHCCCFSACGRYLASCSTDATTVVWHTDSGDIAAAFEHPGRSPVRVCAFSPDSAHLVSGGSDGTLALWDLRTKTLRRTCVVNEATVVACSFSPCGQAFVTGSSYGDLRLWDPEMNQQQAVKNAHDLGVTCCHFAPQMQSDGDSVLFRLSSCGQDSLLKIWIISHHAEAGWKMQLLYTLAGQSAPVLSCSFSADGQLLVSGSVDKTVTVYDANQGVLLYTLKHHERYVTACAFSPTVPLIATGSMDKTVNIWRVEDGNSGYWNEGKSLPVANTDASCEGRRLAGHRSLLMGDWSEDDVSAWLHEEGLEALVDTFKANNIDGAELLSLSKEMLAMELNIGTAAHAKGTQTRGANRFSPAHLCREQRSALWTLALRESAGLRNKVIRKVTELKMELIGTGVPDEFLCPITREIMKDPVLAADGYSYEREAIEDWIKAKNRSSPMTNLPLPTTTVTPNRTLKMAISRWKASQ